MWQLEKWQAAQFRFHARKDLLEEIPDKESFSPPLYLIALCSNTPLPDNTLVEANSFYLDSANSDQTKKFSRWAQELDNTAVQSRRIIAGLRQELAERTNWAENLDSRIKAQIEIVESLQKELEGRTEWARSLESDLAKERSYSNQKAQELEKKCQELLGIKNEMSASLLYRILRKLKLLPDISKTES
jgi:hypothetical protein